MKRALPWLFSLFLLGCGIEESQPPRPAFDGQLAEARSLLGADRNAEAQAGFQQALEIDPSSTEARMGLAESERRLGDLTGAQRHLEEILGLSSHRDELVQALTGLSDIKRQQGDDSGADDLVAEANALRGASPADP